MVNEPSVFEPSKFYCIFCFGTTSEIFSMVCPPEWRENSRALASGLSTIQVDEPGSFSFIA